MKLKIQKRDIVEKILEFIETDDIVVLHGARQVGKTHILYYLQNFLEKKKKKVHYIDLEDSKLVNILNQGVEMFLTYLQEEGFDEKQEKIYVFIDEIQYLENPSSFLKIMADHHKNIKLIVSGSSSFEMKNKFQDSLVGRTVNFEIFNLSFEEFLRFRDYKWDKKKKITSKKEGELKNLFKEYILYGGYPKIILTKETAKKETYLQQIIDTYIRKDIRDLANIKDIEKFNKLLEILAAQSGNMLNVAELSNTCKIAIQTVEHYLFILENTYILKLVKPYSKNIRSELFKVPKIYFYDTGLLQMLWLKSIPKTILGNILETGIFGEIVKKYGKNNIFYWRTTDKKEIDFIVKQKSIICPIEVKLNFEKFSPTAMNYFTEKYDIKDYQIIALEGDKKRKEDIHPWEI